jgi:putative transposase
MNQSEKMEIITIVEQSILGVKATLQQLGINRSTFYKWYKRYLEFGYDGLADKLPKRQSYWNQLPAQERQKVVDLALERTELSCREIACHIVDKEGWFVSESTVYRILKSQNLITTPAYRLMEASDKFINPTTAVNELWQTDFTYFKIQGWGWYYLSTVMDDYSRYILSWELCSTMQAADAERTLQKAMQVAGLKKDQRPKVLTDNGSAYVSKHLQRYFESQSIKHVRSAPLHPMTQGKIERYHRSMKNLLLLEHYYTPDQLTARIAQWVDYYNHFRYHESLDNLIPADVFEGRKQQKLKERETVKKLSIEKRRKSYIYQKLQTS